MDKTNLELFKQAINEGLSNKFDKLAAGYTEEIVCSESHKLAMRTIVYGKAATKRVWSPKMSRIIAILIAVALILTSCSIVFRNEIREVFKEVFVKLTYDSNDESSEFIEEIYYLSYVPEGYVLEEEMQADLQLAASPEDWLDRMLQRLAQRRIPDHDNNTAAVVWLTQE